MKWEYKIISDNGTRVSTSYEEDFNELGQAGWELVAIQKNVSGNSYYFKRFVEELPGLKSLRAFNLRP